jgi:hypothetical protein
VDFEAANALLTRHVEALDETEEALANFIAWDG